MSIDFLLHYCVCVRIELQHLSSRDSFSNEPGKLNEFSLCGVVCLFRCQCTNANVTDVYFVLYIQVYYYIRSLDAQCLKIERESKPDSNDLPNTRAAFVVVILFFSFLSIEMQTDNSIINIYNIITIKLLLLLLLSNK